MSSDTAEKKTSAQTVPKSLMFDDPAVLKLLKSERKFEGCCSGPPCLVQFGIV